MWRFLLLLCCCCSNSTISTTFPPPAGSRAGRRSRGSWNWLCSLIECKASHFPCDTDGLFVVFFSPNGKQTQRAFQQQHSERVFTLWATPSSQQARSLPTDGERRPEAFFKVSGSWCNFASRRETSNSAEETPLSLCYKMSENARWDSAERPSPSEAMQTITTKKRWSQHLAAGSGWWKADCPHSAGSFGKVWNAH